MRQLSAQGHDKKTKKMQRLVIKFGLKTIFNRRESQITTNKQGHIKNHFKQPGK
jgi:hypothetical protein